MSLEKIAGQVARIGKIVKTWADGKPVSDIERELVLDKLRTLYEEVMFFERETAPAADETPEEGPVAEGPAEALEPEPEPIPVRSAIDRKAILSLYDQQDEEPSCEVAQATLEDTLAAGESAVIAEECELQTEEETEGTEEPPVPEEGLAVTEEIFEQEETLPFAMESIEDEEPSLFGAVIEKIAEELPEEDTKVLGEVMNAGAESLGDVLSKGVEANDLASQVATAQTISLRKAIGINDKFLIISEVFGGNAPAYERTITDLDAFDSLDEAMLYIHENYKWSPKNEGVKVLVEMLTRKLS